MGYKSEDLYLISSGLVLLFAPFVVESLISRSSCRSDEDDGEDSTSDFFSSSNDYFNDTSDIDSVCISARNDFFGYTSVGSSPSDSPSRKHITSSRVGQYVQQEHALLEKPAKGIRDQESIFGERLTQPLDFEANGPIWFPPPPYNVDDEEENSFFTYDDEDDEVGESNAISSSSAGLDSMFLAKEKQHLSHKEPLRAVVQEHFKALVSELLRGQGLVSTNQNCAEDWLNVITAIAWQAASFIKPDTSTGGSMDPCDYVKVKCVASGSPSDR